MKKRINILFFLVSDGKFTELYRNIFFIDDGVNFLYDEVQSVLRFLYPSTSFVEFSCD